MSPRRQPGRSSRPRRARATKPEERWKDVVVAVVRDGERVLVARRPPEAHLGGHDEFPGGRRETGESLEEACVREVKEELGLAVRVVKLLAVAWHEDAERRLALSFYECACDGPTEVAPALAEKRAARWVAIGELGRLDFPPANRDVLRRLDEEAKARAAARAAPSSG
jgi:8-oxo-dGTP diphosphatase